MKSKRGLALLTSLLLLALSPSVLMGCWYCHQFYHAGFTYHDFPIFGPSQQGYDGYHAYGVSGPCSTHWPCSASGGGSGGDPGPIVEADLKEDLALAALGYEADRVVEVLGRFGDTPSDFVRLGTAKLNVLDCRGEVVVSVPMREELADELVAWLLSA